LIFFSYASLLSFIYFPWFISSALNLSDSADSRRSYCYTLFKTSPISVLHILRSSMNLTCCAACSEVETSSELIADYPRFVNNFWFRNTIRASDSIISYSFCFSRLKTYSFYVDSFFSNSSTFVVSLPTFST